MREETDKKVFKQALCVTRGIPLRLQRAQPENLWENMQCTVQMVAEPDS